MQITLNFGRWTKLHSALAIGAALVLAGAVGNALAISPTVQAPIRWTGGIPVMSKTFTIGNSGALFTVPSNSSMMLTDLILSNLSTSAGTLDLYANAGTCNFANVKLETVVIPPQSTLVIPLVTGIGFSPGQNVCVGVTQTTKVNARGYFFVAAPTG